MRFVRGFAAVAAATALVLSGAPAVSASGSAGGSESISAEKKLTPEQKKKIRRIKQDYVNEVLALVHRRAAQEAALTEVWEVESQAAWRQIRFISAEIERRSADGASEEEIARLESALEAQRDYLVRLDAEYKVDMKVVARWYKKAVRAAKKAMREAIEAVRSESGEAEEPPTVVEAHRISAWQDCPTDPLLDQFVEGSNAGKSAYGLCVKAARKARTGESERAVIYAFWVLGSPIVCPSDPDREGESYDSSSLVSRAYRSAGLEAFEVDGRSLTTSEIFGTDGNELPDWATKVKAKKAKPGDIWGYRFNDSVLGVELGIGGGASITAMGPCGSTVKVDDLLTKKVKKSSKVKSLGVIKVDPELARF